MSSAVTVAFGKANADNRAALVGYLPAGKRKPEQARIGLVISKVPNAGWSRRTTRPDQARITSL